MSFSGLSKVENCQNGFLIWFFLWRLNFQSKGQHMVHSKCLAPVTEIIRIYKKKKQKKLGARLCNLPLHHGILRGNNMKLSNHVLDNWNCVRRSTRRRFLVVLFYFPRFLF